MPNIQTILNKINRSILDDADIVLGIIFHLNFYKIDL